ncbi:MAG: hypothetical protein IJD82_00215 [Clostridia bacterium]|nr:hypothetical protein [Clostridia bacterium]
MCKAKKEYADKSFLQFNEKDMKIFYDEIAYTTPKEDWHQKIIKAKQKLKNLDDDALAKEKLETQIKLANATMQNRNTALEFGVPVASLMFSILAIIVSLRPVEPTTYIAFPFFSFFQTILPISSDSCLFFKIAVWLSFCTLVTVPVLLFCYHYTNRRRRQVFYYQTLLNIIESIEKEREHSNRYDVSVHNTETGETKQFDAHLLPNNK